MAKVLGELTFLIGFTYTFITCVCKLLAPTVHSFWKDGLVSCEPEGHEDVSGEGKGPVTHYRCTSPELNRSTKLTTARQSAELRRDST